MCHEKRKPFFLDGEEIAFVWLQEMWRFLGDQILFFRQMISKEGLPNTVKQRSERQYPKGFKNSGQ